MKLQEILKKPTQPLGLIVTAAVFISQGWITPTYGQLIRQQQETLSEQKIRAERTGLRLKGRFRGHTTPIRSLAFSPNGEVVISGGGSSEPFFHTLRFHRSLHNESLPWNG